MQNFENLPDNLPVPIDDGACDHLVGMTLPNLALKTTNGDTINLSELKGTAVVYCYPMTGQPGVALPEGWDNIPGARGCTPQSCAFRDHHTELAELNTHVFGMSTQTTEYQQEMAQRLHLPFPVISDCDLEFCSAMNLPTFEVEGKILMKRVTLIIDDATIVATHYPIFPSDSDPAWVIEFLSSERDKK